MQAAVNALIHEFDPSMSPYYDDEGDQMIGYYYQFVDVDNQPTGGLIGPYGLREGAEQAAKIAFRHKDF